MNKAIKNSNFSLQSYIDNNRIKLDESLVSLRLMKEVENFLEINNISQKDFALSIGYSESYISQLMSGVKKINISFINKFENKYNLEIDFKINYNNIGSKYIFQISNAPIDINFINIQIFDNTNSFEIQNNKSEYINFDKEFIELSTYEEY